MDTYYEQTVAGMHRHRNTFLYVLCWAAIALLAMSAVILGANVLRTIDHTDGIDWFSLICLVICLITAAVLFIRKDALRMEYDYILLNDRLEITGIFNGRRRKRLAEIQVSAIKDGGFAESHHCALLQRQQNVKRHKWCGASCRQYLYYTEGNLRHLALLELDRQMCDLICRQLPAGVWREEEGKT